MDFTFFSIILAVIFLVMGVMVLRGNTDVLGKNLMEQIKPELKMEYCREMSMPIFALAVLEMADAVLQANANLGNWSLIIFGTGLLLCFLWIYRIHSKYKR